jgi:hypothetical protein
MNDVDGVPAQGPSIVRASVEAARAREQQALAISRARGERRLIAVVDDVLEVVETVNLGAGPGRRQEDLVAEWRDWLGSVSDGPLPLRVRDAENALQMHDALLDWQDVLLDRLVPDRGDAQRTDAE